ncbi:MAG: N-acetyltransferase [Variibacter sp.]|nr:N-acetyltransferase [Variibacter sp.]
MVTIRLERSTDIAAREHVLDTAYGPARFAKTSSRLRAGRLPADGLALVAVERGRVVGTVRLWNVTAGAGRPALLLGPLAVACAAQGRGIGGKLMARALREARRLGHRAVLLVGDAAYYGRFGFSAAKTGKLRLPGPFEPHRLLGLELIAGALGGAGGVIRAAGDKIPEGLPDFIVAPAYTKPVALRAAA